MVSQLGINEGASSSARKQLRTFGNMHKESYLNFGLKSQAEECKHLKEHVPNTSAKIPLISKDHDSQRGKEKGF